MPKQPAILITGSNGEIGHGLVEALSEEGGGARLVALDLREPQPEIRRRCHEAVAGDILDASLLEEIAGRFEITTVFHLAAMLSSSGEREPRLAERVNVQGTLNLLDLALDESRKRGVPVRFIFPSSIAVYGLPTRESRNAAPPVKEHEWNEPITMYGCNKLACEHLGRYYARHHRQLIEDDGAVRIDFRSLRFPGLISAATVPTGGTSDYGPEMIHMAARRLPYACFVSGDTALPFMAMPDATRALLALRAAPQESLSLAAYNVGAFNPTAEDFRSRALGAFPGADIVYAPDLRRQRIVHSWPASLDDSRARRDWGFRPLYDLDRTFDEYLLPEIRRRYP